MPAYSNQAGSTVLRQGGRSVAEDPGTSVVVMILRMRTDNMAGNRGESRRAVSQRRHIG